MNRPAHRLPTRPLAWVLALSALSSAWAQSPAPSAELLYDAGGNLRTHIDALGRSTVYRYDSLDRLRASTRASASGPANILIDLNHAGALTAITDPRGLVTRFVPDGLGQIGSQLSPDSGHTLYTYDAAGNLSARIDARGLRTTYTYDAAGRLSAAQYADGSASVYTYDQGAYGIGQLTQLTDPGGLITAWTYTPQGRVLTRSQTLDLAGATLTHRLHYSYEASGKRATLTYPSGAQITLSYEPASGQLSMLRWNGWPIVRQIQWHSALTQGPGAVKQLRLANGLYWTSPLDAYGRIISYNLNRDTVRLHWDSAGRLVKQSRTNPIQTQQYRYDELDRISGFDSHVRTQRFEYDLTGNLQAKTDQVGTAPQRRTTYTIDPHSNRLEQIASLGIGYAYDAAGNRTQSPTLTHTYDARGRLVKTVLTQGSRSKVYTYRINALGQRVAKLGPEGNTIYVYDQDGQLIGEYDEAGRAQKEYIWLPARDGTGPTYRPVALIVYRYEGNRTAASDKTFYAIETDHLGSPRRVSDAQNQTRWRWNPAPYGDTQPNDNPENLGPFTLNLRFAGQYFDQETNLYYNHHRDYESTTGRYIQSDPIGLAGGINTYAYVGGEPTKFTDPEGLYIPGVHNSLAYTQARGTCLDSRAVELGQLTGGVDGLPGSQDPKNSHMHAMCPPGVEKAACRERTINYLADEFLSCELSGLAKVLHAVQDSFAPGHEDGQVWKGMPWEKGGESYGNATIHFIGDLAPLSGGPARATRQLIREWCEQCGQCSDKH